MAVNRYDLPTEVEYISQYTPIPFDLLYRMGKEYNDLVDKAAQQLSGAILKWSEFRSPSQRDTQRWYDFTVNAAKPLIDKLVANPDLIKTQAGRSEIQQFINTRPYAQLSDLIQSRDAMLQRLKMEQELSVRGLYNPLWHKVDYTNYDTTSSRIFNDLTLTPYKSEVDLVKPYVDNLKPSYLYTKNGYDYKGVSTQTTDDMVLKNLSAIYNTPEAQMHLRALMRQGYTPEQAQEIFTDRIYRAGREFSYEDREANPYQLERSKNKTPEFSGIPIGWNDILSKQYSDKLRTTVTLRSMMDSDYADKYNAMLEGENDPTRLAEIQVLAMDEAIGRNVTDAFRKELGLKENENPFAKMDIKGEEGNKYYTDSRISKMWAKGLNTMYEKATPGALRNAKNMLFGDTDNTVEYGAHKSKGYIADGIDMLSPKQYMFLNNRYINQLAQEAEFDPSTYRDRDTWTKSNLDIEELVASKQIGNVIIKDIKGFIDSESPDRGATRDYVVRVAVPISELNDKYTRWWAIDDLPKTLKQYGFTVEKGGDESIGSEGYVSFDMVVPSPNNEIDITTSNRGYEEEFGTSTTQKEIVGADNLIMQTLRGILPGNAWNLK